MSRIPRRHAAWGLAGAGAAVVLSACGPFPDARNRSNTPARQAERAARQTEPPAPPGRLADPGATACLNAAVAAGFTVLGLDPSTRPVGASTIGVRVRGPGAERTLPCVYTQATGQARMLPG